MTKVLEIAGSRKVAVALLFAVLAACAAGTFLPLERAVPLVYHSPWFLALLLAFSLNTIACTALEISRRKVPLGFLFIHVGSLVLLAGGAWGYLYSVKGRVGVEVGETVSSFEKDWKGVDVMRLKSGEVRKGHFLGVQAGMPGHARQGESDSAAMRRTAVFTPMGEQALFVPVEDLESIRVDQDRPGRASEGDMLRLATGAGPAEVFVESVTSSGVVARPADGSAPAAETPHSEIMILRMGSPSTAPLGYSVRLDDFRILYHESTVVERVSVQAQGQDPVFLPPEPGAKADLGGGMTARVARYIPDAVMDRETKKVESRSNLKVNPAVELEIAWEGGTETRYAFRESMPGFHMKRYPSGVTVRFESTEGMPKAYISSISIIEEGRVVERAQVEVNSPYTYGGYTIYQESWGASGGVVTSFFSIHRDPGLGAVYAGFILLMIGCVEAFYVRPVVAAFRRSGNHPAATGAAAGGA